MSRQITDEEWESLTISNDFIFSKVMCDKAICKEIAELLLGFELGDTTDFQEEKSINITQNGKSVRLDVYFKSEDKMINIEMQVTNRNNLRKRCRFYQDLMDLDFLQSGEKYRTLPESYVVFLCTFDPFGEGLPHYFYEYRSRESGKPLEDGTYKVFFNSTAYEKVNNEKLQAFLRYVNGEMVQNEFVERVDKRIKQVKANTEWRKEFMKWELDMQDIAEENYERGKTEGVVLGEARGRALGEEQGKINTAKNLLDILDNTMIALTTGLPLEQIEMLRNGAKSV